MDNKKLYSPKTQLIFRLFSLMAILVLVVSNMYVIFSQDIFLNFKENPKILFSFVCNVISCVCFMIVIIFPSKIGFFSFISFSYSLIILLFEPENQMGIFMYCLCLASLMARGFLKKYKKIKSILFILIFLILILSELRFGINIFINSLIDKVGYLLVFSITVFFLYAFSINLFELNKSSKKLDIKEYSDLKLRDAKWLIEILNNKKYQYIATEYNITLGAVKNRMKIIFKTLGVGDKQGFLNKYENYEIYYGEKVSSII